MSDVNGDIKQIFNILKSIFGKYKNKNEDSGQISFDCPVCSYEIKGLDVGDGKGNLEINVNKDAYKCWACYETYDTHGSVGKLIKTYGNEKQFKRYLLLKPENVDLKKQKIVTQNLELPKEFIPLNNVSDGFKLTHHYKKVMNYLKKRKVTDKIIRKYNIGFAYDGEYANRVIIPSYDTYRKLNYFVSRTYLDNVKNKYKNPVVEKSLIIFNESLINWENKVYLVEGPFDSIFLDNSIPLLGKYISDDLFNKLYDKKCEITIVLDGDAWDEAERLYHKINCGKLFGKVSIIKLPKDKDIADLCGDLSDYKEFKLD